MPIVSYMDAAFLDAFDIACAKEYRSVVHRWRDNWGNFMPFFQFLPEVRKVIYTTNTIHHRKPALQSFQLMLGEDRIPLKAM